MIDPGQEEAREGPGPRAAEARGSRGLHIPPWLGFCLFLGVALFFLWEEHEAHILGALPYLLLLACPIVHLLMHRGHGHGGHHGHDPHARDGRR